ncbi:MAG: GTPase ObgE [Phycisphaerales bacterium]|nr:GTPase ObgE [Phycisphaerales bacterium]
MPRPANLRNLLPFHRSTHDPTSSTVYIPSIMFVDSAVITVKAGHGGSGAVKFRRQKYEPKGGPEGGDGGRGGDVVLVADSGMNTLLDFRGRPDWEAEPGGNGLKKQMHGSDGRDCVIKVPAGTIVTDNLTGELIVDMKPEQRFIVAKGGNGGFGNEHYKNAVHQAPTHAHPGFPGEEKQLKLELKLLADVGLLGMPNAGKSTLLAALTRANPKIAAYPFTTLAPQLGVAELDPTRRLVIADIPGLIEGASQGTGLGLDFLKHVERTRVLVHLLDVMPPEGTPAENYRIIRQELFNYSPVLAEREELIVLNKLDLFQTNEEREAAVKALRKDLKLGAEVEVLGLSAAARMGTHDLLEKLWSILNRAEKTWEGVSTPKAESPAKSPKRPAPTASTKPTTKPAKPVASKKSAKPKPAAKKSPAKKSAAKPKAQSRPKATKPKAQKTSKKPKPAASKKPPAKSKKKTKRSAR